MSVAHNICVFLSLFVIVITFPFSIWLCLKVVSEYERLVIFRLGRLRDGKARGPGMFFVIPCTDSCIKLDMRTVSFDVPTQEALSKDSVSVAVDAVVFYRVLNPLNAVTKVEDFVSSTQLLAMTTLRNILGTKNLSEVLSEREELAGTMRQFLDVATEPWGIEVERVELKDVRLPFQLQRAMAAEAEASREARAKVVAAEGEMNASKTLRKAADVINQSPAALQLRYLQTLNTISAEKNTTILFPLPIEILSPYVKSNIRQSFMKCMEHIIVFLSVFIVLITFPISIFLCFRVAQEFERLVIFRLGHLRSGRPRGPGIIFVMPCIDEYAKIDLRTISLDVPTQEALSKDCVSVQVDAVVYYRVQEPLKAILEIFNFGASTRLLAMTTLRNILGTKSLTEVLLEKEEISVIMRQHLDEATDPWGIAVERVEIKDVRLPFELQRAMAAEAESAREAKARIIAAEGELNASQALKEAAEIMAQSPTALQLRYLQTLNTISSDKNQTIIFPLPIDIISHMMGKRTR